MKYGQIQGIREPVSRIIFGCASPAMLDGADVSEVLDAAVACGINTFDTARQYGKSEDSLGKWVHQRKNREQILIETKGCHPDVLGRRRVSAKCIRRDIETSLRRLRTDYIDIYLLHRDHPAVEVAEIVEALNEQRRAGRIRAFGGSNWTPERIQEANAYARKHGLQGFTVSSPNFGLAVQHQDPFGGGCRTLTGADMEEARAWYRRESMPVLAYSSLARGLMSGKVKSGSLEEGKHLLDIYAIRGFWCEENLERLRRAEELAAKKRCSTAQLAVAWMFTQGLDVYAILSSNNAGRLRSNVAALEVELTPQEAAWLNLETEAAAG